MTFCVLQADSWSVNLGTKTLPAPPSILSTERFRASYLDPSRLVRISSYRGGEPFFGVSGFNRFDAPGALSGNAEYGACYLGQSLAVAIAESVLHDAEPVDGRYLVAPEILLSRHVWRFSGTKLKLLALHGTLLKRLGGTAELSGTGDYILTQRWAGAVFSNPAGYDGFSYMSRHLSSGKAVVLFDRAKSKLVMGRPIPLMNFPGFAAAARSLGIHGGDQ